jgi:aspartate/methionine/tyrosine aminotransferase
MLVAALRRLPGFRCALPGGAFYAFPNVAGTGFDSRTLQARLLEEAGVALISGTSFGAFGEGFLRFSYASSLEALAEAVQRIERWLAANAPKAAASA